MAENDGGDWPLSSHGGSGDGVESSSTTSSSSSDKKQEIPSHQPQNFHTYFSRHPQTMLASAHPRVPAAAHLPLATASRLGSRASLQSSSTGRMSFSSRGRQLKKGLSSTGSFFSLTKSPVKVGKPSGFRHIAGSAEFDDHPLARGHDYGLNSAPGSVNTRIDTQSVLLDVHTQSRLGTCTSLPVSMPNAVSPIDNANFDASSTRSSTRPGTSPIPTSYTPEVSDRNQEPASSVALRFLPRQPSFLQYLSLAKIKENLDIVISLVFIHLALVSSIAALGVTVHISGGSRTLPTGVIAWLSVSIAMLVLSGAYLIYSICQRWPTLRYRQRRSRIVDEEAIHMSNLDKMDHHGHSVRPNYQPGPEPQPQSALMGPDESEPEGVGETKRASIIDSRRQSLLNSRRDSKRIGGIFDAQLVEEGLQALEEGQTTPRASLIGIARSDSLLLSAARRQRYEKEEEPSMTSSSTVTGAADEPESESDQAMLGDRTQLADPSSPFDELLCRVPTGHSLPSSSSSSQASTLYQFHVEPPTPPLPRQVTPPPPGAGLPSCGTHSTLDSLYGAYGAESYTARPHYEVGAPTRPEEALGSHPVVHTVVAHPQLGSNNPFRLRQITTEVGTPESQKSLDRRPQPHVATVPGPEKSGDGQDGERGECDPWAWGRTMTPIDEERSESAHGCF